MDSQAQDPVATAARYAAAGGRRTAVRSTRDELCAAVGDPHTDARVRVAALGALARNGTRRDARRAWRIATQDPVAAVRRRAAELTPTLRVPAAGPLLALLDDDDPLVAEGACWAAGEVAWPPGNRSRVVATLVRVATHPDPLVREAAIAALGALGDPAGLPAVIAGCRDRPAIRRRAVLALAPFDGPAVEAALAAALEDPDWQTRQSAEDLTVRTSD